MRKLISTPIHCQYEVKGMVSFEGLAMSTITFNLTMDVGNNTTRLGTMTVLRVPCRRNINGLSAVAQTRGEKVTSQTAARLALVVKDMGISGEFTFDGPRTYLEQNDLYFIRSMFINNEHCNEGADVAVLASLPSWIQMLTGDAHPVIAVLPAHVQEKRAQVSAPHMRRVLYEAGYRSVSKSAKTMIYIPNVNQNQEVEEA